MDESGVSDIVLGFKRKSEFISDYSELIHKYSNAIDYLVYDKEDEKETITVVFTSGKRQEFNASGSEYFDVIKTITQIFIDETEALYQDYEFKIRFKI